MTAAGRGFDISEEPLHRDPQGHPCSTRYGDIYASRAGAFEQAHAVFLAGCGLASAPRAWAGRGQFVILETGFGLGTNFMATLQAWRHDPERPQRLHYVAIELHPLAAHSLIDACADPALDGIARELAAAWPVPRRGLHTLHFDGGRVSLTLALGDAAAMLAQLSLGADAIFLDGFAPSRNPAMWSPEVMKGVARLARPGARLGTYTVARPVRDALAAAGFEVEMAPGFGGKRERLQAVFAPRWPTRRAPPRAAWAQSAPRHAVVLGAGLAGAACARAMANRGWRVDVLDARTVAAGASGLPAGLAHQRPSLDDNHLSRLTRHGLQWLKRALATLEGGWIGGGVFVAAPREPARPRCWPAAMARTASATEVTAQTGIPVQLGGHWTDGGVVAVAALVRQWLDHPSISLRSDARVQTVRRTTDGSEWEALGADGHRLAHAPIMIVATALDAARLLPRAADCAPLRPQFGQGFLVPASAMGPLETLRHGIMDACYALPLPAAACAALELAPTARWLFVGATYEGTGEAPMTPAMAWDYVRHGLGELVGTLPVDIPSNARLFSAVRAVTSDRLPLVGAWPDWNASQRRGARALDLAPCEGLHVCTGLGSRGLVLAALAAEIIACAIEGEPAPLERDLLSALAPGRFTHRR